MRYIDYVEERRRREERGGRTRYVLSGGVWEPTTPAANPDLPNFVIVCEHGDWSGFRTLADCLAQLPAAAPYRPPGFYWIEER